MKGGTAIYCPACNHRQVVGKAGEVLALPRNVTCENCGSTLVLDKSRSGGVHVAVSSPAT